MAKRAKGAKKGGRKAPARRPAKRKAAKPKKAKARPKKPVKKEAPKKAAPKKEPKKADAKKPSKPKPPTIRSIFDDEESVCSLEFLSDGRAFIARIETPRGGQREHRAPAFVDLLELVAEDLREEFLEV